MKKNSALANLGWPFSKMDEDGVLNWEIRRFDEPAAFGSAMVSLRGDWIRGFANARSEDGKPLFDVELSWLIVNGVANEAVSCLDGKTCEFGRAIDVFQAAIAMAEPPMFEPTGSKVGAAPVVAGPVGRGGAL